VLGPTDPGYEHAQTWSLSLGRAS